MRENISFFAELYNSLDPEKRVFITIGCGKRAFNLTLHTFLNINVLKH